MQHPTIAWQDGKIRIVSTSAGHVVEVAAGSDAMGGTVWRTVPIDPEPLAEGWKELCDVVKLDPNQWRRLLEASQRPEDPAPIRYDPWGTPTASRVELRLWQERNTLHARVHRAVRVAPGSPTYRPHAAPGSAPKTVRRTGTTR